MVYRIGLIGIEGHENYTLGAMEDMPNTMLAAITTNNTRGVEQFQRKFDKLSFENTKIYENHEEMLEKENLDIVSVYTHHGSRAECIIDAAKSGAAVYTEKPLSRTLDELEEVKQAVEQNGTHLTMMLNLRFHGAFMKIRELIQKGAIGEVTQATAQKSYKLGSRAKWMRDSDTFAGIIPFIACHALDLILWCGGLEFVKGSAFENTVGRPELNDFRNTASVITLAKNGATCSTRLDFCRPMVAESWGDDRLRFAGVEGIIEYQHGKLTLLNTGNKLHEVDYGAGMSQFKNFIASIEGREELVIPFHECHRITEVCLKLHNAAQTQQIIDL